MGSRNAQRFRAKSPSVVSEIIDGEVVVLNLDSGNYYSADQVGAVLWRWMELGFGTDEMLNELRRRFPHTDPAEMGNGIANFFAQLEEHNLVVAVDAPREASGEAINGAELGGAFVTPALQCYSDMQDLLLLDPIHDVDEAGWPTPKDSSAEG